MSIFSFLKRKQVPNAPGPEDDGRFANAVVIEARDSTAGVRAERDYIMRLCGEQETDWKIREQSLVEHNGKPYDKIVVTLSSGEARTLYFDISKFFGK